MTKRITIVGGGYAGTMLAKALDNRADVTLIEPRDKWVHNVAMIRAMAQPDLLDQIIMPYDGLLQNGRMVLARAKSFRDTTTILENGEEISGDIVVVATGSQYAAPFKMQGDDSAAFLKNVRKTMTRIDKAGSIAIVGAGAVGVELAGEIAAVRPEKQITLVTADNGLFPDYPKKLGRSIARQLGELGVKLRLGERIAKLEKSDQPYKPATGKLLLSDGFPINVDLVIPAIGTLPVTDIMKSVEGVDFAEDGRVIVDKWLRPVPHNNLFAIGDIASTSDTMTIVGLTRQVEWLTKTLKAVIGGKPLDRARPYKPWPKPLILLPLGEDKGASALPFGVTGPLLTSAIKGRKLFIPRYHKQFDWQP
ncbi:NADH dehydrogenase, FAD-containing subunit [Parasphingorhabdus marina DSM 22363]|uniref:NADH dehydrogenase, FAD-containing subunit n=1 Tax=Parasphingorhabdus marina DSM 22363 TaxID=1123272 RepID=A0A1N6CP21_9SPHN|nr:FAD-dependent oxidoreductase [Parasphingorhabdus marina]SIN60303.1 NADH dehydrogenase, FAD-containing subunit [Parasphingorhabdus marina DSM 22363]